ncbi:MAG: hypothetical protein JSS49_08360 [Planctomycetes bacterium]|nr:hypothetical protein [Planctomycetota bacterium]
MSSLRSSQFVELHFKAPSECEPHLLCDPGGEVPADLLDQWTAEFRRVWEKSGGVNEPFKHTFRNYVRGIPRQFDVSFQGTGRNRSAVLRSCDDLWNGVAQSLVRSPAAVGQQPDWREACLQDLSRILADTEKSEAGAYFLDSAQRRFRELLRSNPERVSLLVFGAFIAVSHEQALRDGDQVLSALYDGASAELHHLSGVVEETAESRERRSVFDRLARMFRLMVSLG